MLVQMVSIQLQKDDSYNNPQGIKYDVYLKDLFSRRYDEETSLTLFIHKSTLFYRFDKMKQIFGIRLDDKDALFAYEYSLKIMK